MTKALNKPLSKKKQDQLQEITKVFNEVAKNKAFSVCRTSVSEFKEEGSDIVSGMHLACQHLIVTFNARPKNKEEEFIIPMLVCPFSDAAVATLLKDGLDEEIAKYPLLKNFKVKVVGVMAWEIETSEEGYETLKLVTAPERVYQFQYQHCLEYVQEYNKMLQETVPKEVMDTIIPTEETVQQEPEAVN